MTDDKEELARLKRQGALLLRGRRFEQARDHYSSACARYTNDPELLLNLGVAYAELGNFAGAAAAFHRTTTLLPDSTLAHASLGRARHKLGQFQQAVASYRRASVLAPDDVRVMRLLAQAQHAAGNFPEAISTYRGIAARSPDDFEVRARMGDLNFEAGLLEQAAADYRDALSRSPDSAETRVSLGQVLGHLGELDEAESCFRAVLAVDEEHQAAIAGLADLMRYRGDTESAGRLLRECIDAGAASTYVLVAYAKLAPGLGETQRAIALLKERLAEDPDGGQRSLHFALGQLYDRQGLFDTAFAHFQRGNQLKQAMFVSRIFAQEVDGLIRSFSKESLAALPRSSPVSETPVFIVGMLRSGSTLVEQILASHPDVAGAGELNDIGNMVAHLQDPRQPGAYPGALAQLDPARLQRMSKTYLAHVARIAPGAKRVVDKALTNFLHLGLIEILFPGARIIHCTRDPLDTCLSCYFHDFVGTHHYTYDLGTLGRFYRQYQRLMAHWSEVLSLPLMQVSYERLVADPEGQSRAIIGFCGLDWDERCGQPHKTARSVVTSSSQQVRDPVYNTSVARYRNYETHLQALRDGLCGRDREPTTGPGTRGER